MKLKSIVAGASILAAAAVSPAHAALDTSCSVSVSATHNNVIVETYTRKFSVSRRTPYFEDLSTRTREKAFGATVVRAADGVRVHISYFSDLGTFHAASFEADMIVARKLRITSGSTGFHLSTNDTPVGGNHRVVYTLTCVRDR